MQLIEQYMARIRELDYQPDEVQLAAMTALEQVGRGLIQRREDGLARRALRSLGVSRPKPPVQGLYLWGGVGRGKTFMMDLFFEALPFERKLRFHFHRMMYRVHGQLKELGNEADPLAIVADDLAEKARVLCFDEFFVSDIGDAMILGRLMRLLFERGVTLVATSNIPPEELYKDGLQRQQFLPAIDQILANTRVLHVDSDTDYRLRVLEQAEIWHSPLDTAAEENLASYFERIAPTPGVPGQTIEVLGRELTTRMRADGIAWFEFAELCDGPRSQSDYIELARAFQTVLLANVPVMNTESEDQARRFIALVDEFYDRRVKLIVSAAEPIRLIYTGKKLAMEFERTRSRLLEMQSEEYLAAPHRC